MSEKQNPGSIARISSPWVWQNTQRQLPARTRVVQDARIFYVFTFSPPKSISIQALVARDSRILESHNRAVRVAAGELEKLAGTRFHKGKSTFERQTGNIICALFRHDTSRALDPHLHTHCIMFNATRDPVENRWKALSNYEMLQARKFAENVYYHELARDLRAFDYDRLRLAFVAAVVHIIEDERL